MLTCAAGVEQRGHRGEQRETRTRCQIEASCLSVLKFFVFLFVHLLKLDLLRVLCCFLPVDIQSYGHPEHRFLSSLPAWLSSAVLSFITLLSQPYATIPVISVSPAIMTYRTHINSCEEATRVL